MARPSEYTQETADKICAELSMGVSLRTVCKADHLPCIATVFNWFRSYPEFLEQYTRAKEESADAMAEDILDISDNATNDWMETDDDAGYRLNGENIQRSRLRVESRKWLMSKQKPKKYGDKIQQEITAPEGVSFNMNFDGESKK
tara:strand:+ start:15042 stop:15476 length:435 start_codon:yes stop_codon:yes gene_type:complete